jgi:hypothetical protein
MIVYRCKTFCKNLKFFNETESFQTFSKNLVSLKTSPVFEINGILYSTSFTELPEIPTKEFGFIYDKRVIINK